MSVERSTRHAAPVGAASAAPSHGRKRRTLPAATRRGPAVGAASAATTVRFLPPLVLLLAIASPALADSDGATPRVGDIVLSRGGGLWSDVFAGLNRRDRRYSHAGIVVEEGGALAVVHAAADDDGGNGAVRLDSFEAYRAASRELALLRLADPAAAGRAAAAALAMHAAALPFDFDFRLGDDTAVYCGELVWRALSTALGHDPLPNKPFMAGRQVVLIENLLLDVPELNAVER